MPAAEDLEVSAVAIGAVGVGSQALDAEFSIAPQALTMRPIRARCAPWSSLFTRASLLAASPERGAPPPSLDSPTWLTRRRRRARSGSSSSAAWTWTSCWTSAATSSWSCSMPALAAASSVASRGAAQCNLGRERPGAGGELSAAPGACSGGRAARSRPTLFSAAAPSRRRLVPGPKGGSTACTPSGASSRSEAASSTGDAEGESTWPRRSAEARLRQGDSGKASQVVCRRLASLALRMRTRAQEAPRPDQEAAQGQEGGALWREARASAHAPARHDRRARDDRLDRGRVQRQDVQPGAWP